MSPYLVGFKHFEILNIPPGGEVKCLFSREAVFGGEAKWKPRLPGMATFNYLEGTRYQKRSR